MDLYWWFRVIAVAPWFIGALFCGAILIMEAFDL